MPGRLCPGGLGAVPADSVLLSVRDGDPLLQQAGETLRPGLQPRPLPAVPGHVLHRRLVSSPRTPQHLLRQRHRGGPVRPEQTDHIETVLTGEAVSVLLLD